MTGEIQHALKVLREGGTLLYPTDTIWGIGCDATNEKAVEKIYTIKQRTDSKSLIVLVSDEGMLNRFVRDVPEQAWELIEIADSPLTLIYDQGRNLAMNVLAADGSIGVRMVRRETDEFCHTLIYKFGKPIVSTSANLAGQTSPQNFSEISQEIIKSVDHVVNWRQQENIRAKASSIIKIKGDGEIKIIRK